MLRFLLCTLSILCLTTIVIRAQVFPIQSQVNLVPPYSGNLSDYTFPGSQRLTVSLTCNDITILNYRVKLRLTIEGLGITLRSKPNISFEPFILDGGSPLLLYGDDLAQYLDPRNLDFIGLSKTEYQRTGKLPEGVYRFHIEVLDYNRGTVVSNKGFATAWIMFNDVPILNLPSTNSKVRIIDPTNIAFTWTPRHTGSPNAAFTTEYIFRLIEIWPSNRNPNDAFLTQTPLYEVETIRSQIVYGPGEPLLIPGRKYAWQVQARDTEGRDLFKNNGKSEVFVFQFGDAIEMPQNLRKETANATTISIRWETSPSGEIPERFRIRYRADGGSTWYEDVTTNYFHTLTSLANNKAYDIQVRAEAGRQVSDYTFNQRHSTTAVVADSTYQCGNPFSIVPPVMTTPLQNMNPGDIFKCADFDHVLVTEVVRLQATPGGFRGKGFVRINGFNRANFAVEFSGTFNSEYVLVTGSMKTISDPGNTMSNLIEEMKKIGEKPPVMDSTAANPDSNLIIISGLIDSVYFNSSGEIVVLEDGGSTQTFEHKKNAQGEKQEMIVKDDAGNTWTVDKDGNISKAEAAIAGVYSSRDSLNFVVNFRDNEAALYGFDPDNQFPTPTSVKVNNRDYFVRWKSVEQGKQDFVDAFVEGSSKFPEKVGLKIETQNVSTQPGTEPNTSKVIFPGAFDGDKQELLAYAKLKASGSSSEEEVILGKLNVVTYEFIQKKVIVVPVNAPTSLTGPQIQSRLNNIYGQAVAGWHVTVEDVFNIGLEFIEKLDEEESGNLASYNKKMREFNRAYKNSSPAFDKNAFYIFLIKGTGFRFNAFMPFKRGFGYVFVDQLERAGKDPLWAIAHELGHGAFSLRHTFDEHAVTQGSTNNLMDYSGGELMKKCQWDYVHDPESMVGWLQDDEEGASSSLVNFKLLLDKLRDANNDSLESVTINEFVDKSGEIIAPIQLDSAQLTYLKISMGKLHSDIFSNKKGVLEINPRQKQKIASVKNSIEYRTYEYDHFVLGPMGDSRADSVDLRITIKRTETKQFEHHIGIDRKPLCTSGFCCSKCGRDLAMTPEKFTELFPRITANKLEYINAFNTSLQEPGFLYNSCERQAKILAQIAIETNHLTATKEGEGRTWRITGSGELLDYFKATAKAKLRWFNQEFWSSKLYKKFSQVAYYEKIDSTETIAKNERYKPTDSTDHFGIYQGIVQPQFHVQIPILFVKDTMGNFKMYPTPSLIEKAQIEKNIFNYAYGNAAGNGDYLTSDDGYNYRGKGGIQVTGRASYIVLNNKLKASPYNEKIDIVKTPDAVADIPRLVIFSAFIHFKGQLNGEIARLDELEIEKVSALINTGNENGVANHSTQRTNKYDALTKGQFKCQANDD